MEDDVAHGTDGGEGVAVAVDYGRHDEKVAQVLEFREDVAVLDVDVDPF